MFIPANTVMMLNCYSLHHNEERYAASYVDGAPPFNPGFEHLINTYCRLEFNPERFIDDKLSSTESSKLANPMERDHWAFGAG